MSPEQPQDAQTPAEPNAEQAAEPDVVAEPDAVAEPHVLTEPRVVAAPGTGQMAGHEQAASSGGGPLLSKPTLLHPSSILFDTISHIRKYLVPAGIAVYSAAQGGQWGLGIAGFVFCGSFVSTLFRYFTLRYRVQGDDFIVTEGLLFRRVRSVPIRRIQNMDLVQNVLHRIFGVAEVNIETASGTEPEATLRVLTRAQIAELRQAIFGARTSEVSRHDSSPRGASSSADYSDAASERATGVSQEALPRLPEASAAATQAIQSQRLLTIPLGRLVAAGLANNRGLVLLGVLLGFYFQGDYFGDMSDRFSLDFLEDPRLEQAEPASLVLLALLAGLALMLVLRVVSVAWYVLRFYGYQLQRCGEDLHISCGLFTKVSATVPRRRIQFISIHRPLLMRQIGLASIRIETAGGAGNENESAAATVSRRWFVPVIEESEVVGLLAELRPGLNWHEPSVTWHAVSPRTWPRLMRQALICSLITGLVGLGLTRPWGWTLGGLLLPLFVWLAWKHSRAVRYARTDWGIAFRSGIFTRKLSFAFYDRIQTLLFAQSPLDRRWNMATLQVDSAAAGPAEHTITVRYLDAEFAMNQFNELQVATARHQPSWS